MHLRRIVDRLPDPGEVLVEDTMRPAGHWEEAVVPDTLDLAHHAELAANVLTASIWPDDGYAVTQSFRFGSVPPSDGGPAWMPMKYVRALPMMRTMCGSELNLNIERETMRAILAQVGKDGQIYCPISADGPPGGTSYPVMNGLAVLAMLNWYGRDRNPGWLDWVRLAVEGLKDAAIRVGDYAYIPPESSLSSDGRWHWTLRGGGKWPPGYTQYTPPAEPISDQQGFEGAVKWEQSNVIKALVRAYEVLGDEEALQHAWRLARFCLKPNMWEDTSDDGYPGNEHGIWAGHFHGNMNSLQALLDLAVASKDSRLRQIVREGYEHARRHGVIRLGWMPSWITPERFGRPARAAAESEGCGIADTLALAVKLSDAGLGDYWDDVDAMVRNHFIELQVVDLERMRLASGGGTAYDDALKPFIGGFTQASLTANLNSSIHGCCTGNGTRSLYHAWEGITRYDRGVATVNLFLNRSAAWMDVTSYLPYEGRLLLHNRQAHTVLVRVPHWLEATQLRCYLNDGEVSPSRSGGYLVFEGLKPGHTIRLEFPVPETTESWAIGDTTYSATIRGSTVVDIGPRHADTSKYPFFQREHMKAAEAPARRVKRFIADHLGPVY